MCVYLFFVVIITSYLFVYNRFGTASFNKIVVFSNREIDSIKKGALIFMKRDHLSVKKGDTILFYNVYNLKGNVLEGKVVDIEKTNEDENTLKLDNGRFLSSSYVIGKTKDAFVIPLVGYVTQVISSTMGYLFFVILPTFSLLIYQINNIFKKFNF